MDRVTAEAPPPPTKPRQSPKHNQPHFDARTYLYQLCGVDLTSIDGIEAGGALALIAEIGTDMSRWPSANHFVSWLGLCPAPRFGRQSVVEQEQTDGESGGGDLADGGEQLAP